MATANEKKDIASADLDIKKTNPNLTHDAESDLKVGQTITQLDESELFLQQHGIQRSHLATLLSADNAEAQRRLVRRIDLLLLPLLCGTYMLQFIDKQALGYSAVFDLFTSTGMTSDQYSWMASIFYFAYLVAEWPASYLVQKLPTGKVIAVFVFCWGSIMCITTACKDFPGMAACRFFLGAFEAVITPAFMMLISQWYTRTEQPARAGAFYCFNGIGSMVGGILFYGVGQAKGWTIWRIIYILCGGMTVVWGVVLWFFLPDSILTAKRFTVEERTMLIARSASNQTGIQNRTIKKSQILEVFKDPQIWLLFFYVLLNEVINGGIANFSKLIVKGFTVDPLLTTAYGIPYGALNAIYNFSGPFLASKFKNVRTFIMMAWLMPTLVAACLFWQLPRTNKGGLLAGYYICASYVGGLVVALQMPAANVGGYTKRVTATAFVFLAYCAGNIIGPHGFLGTEAPVYETGCKLIISCCCGQAAIALALRFLLIHRNKKRDEAAAAAGITEETEGHDDDDDDEVMQDLTDFENAKFRYSY